MIICYLCDRTDQDIKRFINHHLRYKAPRMKELIAPVCFACHERLHGRRTYHHYFEKVYGKDLGPYMFSRRVVDLYDRAWGGKIKDEIIRRKIKSLAEEK